MRTRLGLILALAAAAFPSTALADSQPAPANQQPAPSGQQPAPSGQQPAPADQTQPPSQQPPSCLASKAQAPDATSIRGVHVGGRAVIRDGNGNPMQVASISYCVDGGGLFSFALTPQSDVVLVLSTAEGDSIGRISPTSSARSARAAFPKMSKLIRRGETTVYRIDQRRQLIIGVAAGRVDFVAAADRLLLEYPHKLGYYLHRLGF